MAELKVTDFALNHLKIYGKTSKPIYYLKDIKVKSCSHFKENIVLIGDWIFFLWTLRYPYGTWYFSYCHIRTYYAGLAIYCCKIIK